jgi:hypothetical protein
VQSLLDVVGSVVAAFTAQRHFNVGAVGINGDVGFAGFYRWVVVLTGFNSAGVVVVLISQAEGCVSQLV